MGEQDSVANGIRLSKLRRDIKNNVKTWTWEQVYEVFKDHSVASNVRPECWDLEYVSLPEKVWKDFLKHSNADDHRYIANQRDCDDFAKILRGDAAKLALSGCGLVVDLISYHAYNCLLVHDEGETLGLLFIEPQNDNHVRVGQGDYKLGEGKAIF